jgi:predicted protein tyrosine phosphatase
MMLKNVYWMPRAKAEIISPKTSEAIISISVPDDPAQLSSNWSRSRLLRLQFHDADTEGNVTLMPHQQISDHGRAVLFNERDARNVIEFVEENKNRVETIYVHCDAGISRSAAIAKFIAGLYKLPFPESYMIYNKHVYRVLTNTYNKMMYGE